MPDTKGQSGIEHFEEAARVAEQTSNDGTFSTIEQAPDTGGGDGTSYIQTRGEPKVDAPAPKPKVKTKKAKKR